MICKNKARWKKVRNMLFILNTNAGTNSINFVKQFGMLILFKALRRIWPGEVVVSNLLKNN